MISSDEFCSLDHPEIKARTALRRLLTREQFLDYIRNSFLEEDGARFYQDGAVRYRGRQYCIHPVTSNMPDTDRVIHRLLFWRRSKKGFFKVANDQGLFPRLYRAVSGPTPPVPDVIFFNENAMQLSCMAVLTVVALSTNYYGRCGENEVRVRQQGAIMGIGTIN